MIRCSATTASDPSICTDGHSTDAGCQAGTITAGLWQWCHCAGQHSSLYLCARRLQSVLNASARLIYRRKRSDYITDALVCLHSHWLRVRQRRPMQTYKVLYDNAPRYLCPLDRLADLPGLRALRSASTSRLVVSSFRLSTVGSRTFNVSAPRMWNALDLKTLFLRRHWCCQ